ncbi:hypothetical protein CJ177_29040 [Rhodococcus sp. ACPA1]|nr:hypothetical protein CJ177_29040 [Rhodococcus sp. ACPA1]
MCRRNLALGNLECQFRWCQPKPGWPLSNGYCVGSWSFGRRGAKFRIAQWAAPAAVTGAQEFGRCSAVRREEDGSSNQSAQRRVTELREDEPIRSPDPSPLSSWWDRVVWGARGSTA